MKCYRTNCISNKEFECKNIWSARDECGYRISRKPAYLKNSQHKPNKLKEAVSLLKRVMTDPLEDETAEKLILDIKEFIKENDDEKSNNS